MIRGEVDTTSGVVEVNGGEPPAFLRGLAYRGDIQSYALSPDRRWTAFTALHYDDRRGMREVRLFVTERRMRRTRLLDTVVDEIGAAQIAGWSPDSGRILFWRIAYGIGSANADGVRLFDVAASDGRPRALTPELWRGGGGILRERPGYLVFAPDGRQLLLVQGCSRFEVENKRLVCRDYATNRLLWMSEPRVAAIQPAWSPDGARIAYVANPDPRRMDGREGDTIEGRQSQRHLFVRDADGKNVRPLTRDPKFREEKPHWRYGLLRFVRVLNARSEERSLWETHGTGGGMRKLRDLPPAPPEE